MEKKNYFLWNEWTLKIQVPEKMDMEMDTISFMSKRNSISFLNAEVQVNLKIPLLYCINICL